MTMEVKTQLAEHPLARPRLPRSERRMEQDTQGAAQRQPPRNQGRHALLSIFPAQLHSTKGPPCSQGQREREVRKATSPKAEPESEKKPAHFPRSLGDAGFQKGPVVPGIVDFDLIQEELKAFKPQTPSAYRFGRLSHHSFFSRHHPQPHHVTHIQDLIGKPVCMVRDEFSLAPLTKSALLSGCLMGIPTISVPVGDPQSIRNPQLSSEAWKKNLKDLASRVANFAKETEARANEAGPAAEQRSEPGKKAFLKEEPPQREQGAKYSAETGRLIPASSYALSRRSRQGQRGHPSGSDGGAQASIPQDQDLLGGLTAPGVRFSGLVGRGPRAGLTEIHLPRRAPTPDFHSYSRHLQHGLGSPQSTSRKQLDDILPLLDWRRKGEPLAEEAARSQESRLLHWMEPLTRHLAEAAHSGQQTAYSESPTSWQTSPDSWRSWILELLCQILQTDSLNAIQFWLLYAPPKEKDLALGLLQTAVARLMPQPLPSLPAEKLLNQVQELQEPPQETQQATYSPSLKKTKTPPLSKTDKPESMGKAQVLRVHPSKDSEEKTTKSKAEN
ncbi:protein TBATA isoform X2 [Mesocricetus auratus]|uniref:Protein TBATA isoform X2 n=1 Tax=Mesocricetus auratus TaxID=10036 RepID=A0ABM2WDK3_MESAU|nr:protein TBATA isoform X2 [Mesocricetus auratus]